MKYKFWTVLALVIFLGGSCTSYLGVTMKADQNMRKIRLGMTKEEVVSVMGKTYKSAGASTSDKGTQEEIYAYTSPMEDEYNLIFEDGILVEWYKVKLVDHMRVDHDD